MLKPEMPSIKDRGGDQLPFGLPAVVDAHVHVFPPHLFSAVWQWFDENAWPIRFRMTTRQIFDFPNIPYAWDRELKSISRMRLDATALERVLWRNAARFYKFEI